MYGGFFISDGPSGMIYRKNRRGGETILIALIIGIIILLESFFLIFKGSKEKRRFLRTAGMVSVPVAILLVWIGLAQMA
jgi:hypothetical protein